MTILKTQKKTQKKTQEKTAIRKQIGNIELLIKQDLSNTLKCINY